MCLDIKAMMGHTEILYISLRGDKRREKKKNMDE
jgi:hypothetical protein